MNLQKTIAFWEQVMTAITFAEANERETARQIMKMNNSDGTTRNEETLKAMYSQPVSGKHTL